MIVFIIIMKIIIMMIIMMVIKRKRLTANVTFLPRAPGTAHRGVLASPACPGSGFCPHHSVGTPASGDECPSSSKKLMPLVTLVCTFSPQ